MWGNCTAPWVPPHPYTVIICPQNKPGFITKQPLPIFDIPLIWLGTAVDAVADIPVLKSALERALGFKICFFRCLEIVCGTIATPTSPCIVERVTVGSTSAFHTILRSSLHVVFLVAPDPVFPAWVPSRVHCS
ncbi:uncharacterized protein TNCV_3869911 [Trichonephila clavipes]|nr:uncharacterized protein TNCV_3869911 [Trichonephila clavipes]